MKSKNTKKIFDNYIISVLLAFLVVAVFNFTTSTVKLITGKTSTPVYAKAVDGIAFVSTETEQKDSAKIEHKSKTIASRYSTPVARATYTATKASANTSGNYVTVGGRSIYLAYQAPVEKADGSLYLPVPASHAAYYRRCIFAHNTAGLFGHLNRASVGETITVSLNGQVKTFRISAIDKNVPKSTINMYRMINGAGHSYAMMTCVGDGSLYRDLIYLD